MLASRNCGFVDGVVYCQVMGPTLNSRAPSGDELTVKGVSGI